MRIKKTLTSIGVLGKILNNKSTSTNDTYSCDYINGNIIFKDGIYTQSSYTLTDNIDNYSKVDITFREQGGRYKTMTLYKPNTFINCVIPINFLIGNDGTAGGFGRFASFTISDATKITRSRVGSYSFTANEFSSSVSNNEVFIEQIIAYK